MTEGMLLGIEPAHVFGLGIGISVFVFSVGIWFHRRIDLVSKRSWRTERAVIIFVKLLLKEKKRLHPKEADDFKEIEEIVNTVLAESDTEAERFKIIK